MSREICISIVLLIILTTFEVTECREGFAPWSNGTCVPRPRKSVVRKALSTLTEAEQLRLRLVVKELKARDHSMPGNSCTFFNVAKRHGYFSVQCQHETTTCFQKQFLPWHRLHMYEFEQAGQTIDPDFALPYWDFTTTYASSPNDTVQSLLPALFTNKTFFNPITNQTEVNPLYSYHVPTVEALAYKPDPNNRIVRNNGTENGLLDQVREQICQIFEDYKNFDDFSRFIECPHNFLHNFVGGDNEYSFTAQTYTAFDPLFYLFHGAFDWLWAIWERRNPGGDDTAIAIKNYTTFNPWGDPWPFSEVKNYQQSLGYSYDSLPLTFDFCDSPPNDGDYVLYADVDGGLPLSFDGGYMVRIIADIDALLGLTPDELNPNDVVGDYAVWQGSGRYDKKSDKFVRKECTSERCNTWCPPKRVKIEIPQNLVAKYNKPFNVSNVAFASARDPGTLPVNLSQTTSVTLLKQEIADRRKNLPSSLQQLKVNIKAGAYSSDPIQCVRDDATKTITVKWTTQSPQLIEYPPCYAEPGDKIAFNYYAPLHSVANVFYEEFYECPTFVKPTCPDQQNPPEGSAWCNFTIPTTLANATYYFICTQEDHCRVRGQRMRVIVGDGSEYECTSVVEGNVQVQSCPSPNMNPTNGKVEVSPPPNESPNSPYSYNYGTQLRYTCNVGYKPNQFPVLECLESGQWSLPFPQCVSAVTECSASELVITNGYYTVNPPSSGSSKPRSTYPQGTEVLFGCNNSLVLIPRANSKVTCDETGTWSPDIPTCKSGKEVPLTSLLLFALLVIWKTV